MDINAINRAYLSYTKHIMLVEYTCICDIPADVIQILHYMEFKELMLPEIVIRLQKQESLRKIAKYTGVGQQTIRTIGSRGGHFK